MRLSRGEPGLPPFDRTRLLAFLTENRGGARYLPATTSIFEASSLIIRIATGERWEGFLETTVMSGRCASASEVIREGPRLVQEREARLPALREKPDASIAEGGHNTVADPDRALDAREAEPAWTKSML